MSSLAANCFLNSLKRSIVHFSSAALEALQKIQKRALDPRGASSLLDVLTLVSMEPEKLLLIDEIGTTTSRSSKDDHHQR